ncbi:PhoH-like ATPase [Lachnospiraceae bacterium PF1-21]|uniref:PhoH family protein n=1 Tax=Ohessyouella blattaphilus TaxID=2949333 RepID=UPI00256D1403|nr:PhoH family protein [Lachnospiraceae bacterium OttesenSCG-928-J05]
MQKTFVLDTNVLLQSPQALYSFEDNNIVLPVVVLEELDHFKNDEGERGAGARQAIRLLEELRLLGNLPDGIALPNGGTLRLEVNHIDVKLPDGWKEKSPDNRILKVCKGLSDAGNGVVLVTKDVVARIKAQMLGIPAEDFTTEQVVTLDKQYTGRSHAYVPDSALSAFHQEGIPLNILYTSSKDGETSPLSTEPNQFLILHSDQSEKKTVLGRVEKNRVVPLHSINTQPFGITPRNVGQRFMQEALLLGPEIAPLVIVKGAAGTAKTLFGLACGLEQILGREEKMYRKILVCRPNVQFDEDIGFLPGTEDEKIAPLMRPIIDNLEILVDRDEKERYQNEHELRDKIDELFDRGIIEAEAMNYIRGRSISNTYLIIDEAQNLSPRQVKGIITRVGKGTKVVLLGDPEQIDHPMLDNQTNGLSYAAEKMKGSDLCFQVTMEAEECERSILALDAASRM